jgi:DNA polymerase-4
MVDNHLPIESRERPLRYLFLDLNSYFASVEQNENPELRGKPVAVVPVEADTSFVIAASYEAKAFGIKTGTRIGEAKQMCPGLVCIHGRHTLYSAYHKRVLQVVEEVLPIEQVCSIDEMRFRLLGEERNPAVATELALKMKLALRENVGPCMTASVGVAPNPFLAKVGTEIQKPDGLVVIQQADLPERLFTLGLTDFPGINKRMQARLSGAGIFTSEQMCRATKQDMLAAFGSVIGERWWYMLRGYDIAVDPTNRKSLGHSHVLAPILRTDQGCREVLQRLLHKAAARLRSHDLWTCGMEVFISGFTRSWSGKCRLPPTQDSVTLNEYFLELWKNRDYEKPRSVGVTFYELREPGEFTPSLFDQTLERSELSHAIDDLNQRFGKNKIVLASTEKVKDTAEERIAFNKTWLFSEGKGDNEWVDTFRGMAVLPQSIPTVDEDGDDEWLSLDDAYW